MSTHTHENIYCLWGMRAAYFINYTRGPELGFYTRTRHQERHSAPPSLKPHTPYASSGVGLLGGSLSPLPLHLVRLGLRLDRLEHGEDREAALVQEVRAHVEQVGQVAHAPGERGVGVGRVARRVARLAEARARAAARDGAGRCGAGCGGAGR